jgi:hypothetical protein
MNRVRSSWLYRPRKAVVVVHVRGRLPADEAGAPQAFLGLTINWGAMLGWSAVHGGLDWAAVGPLYAACISWTMVYDTIYAHQVRRVCRTPLSPPSTPSTGSADVMMLPSLLMLI